MNNFERLPWCTRHSLQLLHRAFKSEVHRFAVMSWSTHMYNEELVWLKDLYILCSYPLVTVIQWIESSKEIVYKNQLDWNYDSELVESECIWPLKSVMNLVWHKLNFGMLSESMHRAAAPIIDAEWSTASQVHLRAGLDPSSGEYPFAHRFSNWFGWLVASQKRPMNFSDKENRHNRDLLLIQKKHSKLALTDRSEDQWEADESTPCVPYTLEDYGFMATADCRHL